MAQVPIDLPLDGEIVHQALDDVALHNSFVEDLVSASLAVVTAMEPDYYWRKSERRRWNAKNESLGEEGVCKWLRPLTTFPRPTSG